MENEQGTLRPLEQWETTEPPVLKMLLSDNYDDTITLEEMKERLPVIFPWFTERRDIPWNKPKTIMVYGPASKIHLPNAAAGAFAITEFVPQWYKFGDGVMLKVAGDEALNTVVISGSKRVLT